MTSTQAPKPRSIYWECKQVHPGIYETPNGRYWICTAGEVGSADRWAIVDNTTDATLRGRWATADAAWQALAAKRAVR